MHLVQNYTKKDIPNSKRIICYKSCQLNLQLIKYSWWWCYSSMAEFSLGFNTTLWIFLYWYSEEFFESIYMGSVWVKSQMTKGRWGLFLYHSCSKCEYVEFVVTKIHILKVSSPKVAFSFSNVRRQKCWERKIVIVERVHILKLGIWLSARFTSCCLYYSLESSHISHTVNPI